MDSENQHFKGKNNAFDDPLAPIRQQLALALNQLLAAITIQ